jgi:nickel-dependent lactate racemase
MAEVKFLYGRASLALDLPEDRLAGVLQAREFQPGAPEDELVRRALAEPVGAPRLRDLVRGRANIALLTRDRSRPAPGRVILPPLLEAIRQGNPLARVTLLVATGCHRASTPAEMEEKLGSLAGLPLVLHDCDRSEFVSLGHLPSGAELRLNRLAMEADLHLAEGFIEPHFFAGCSGGRKSVFPGCTNRLSVMANHCAAFIAHPRARAGLLEGNPIHEDMLDAARQARLAFIVNVAVDADKKIIRAFAGHYDLAHRAGADFVAGLARVRARPADIVITTNGGWPLDQNLYQAVKGLTAAEATCRPGGVIIMAARGEDGAGGETFLKTFREERDLSRLKAAILARRPEATIPDQWQSQILARVLSRARVILVTEAPREMAEDLHLDYAPSLAEALTMAETFLGNGRASITAIPDGLGIIVEA